MICTGPHSKLLLLLLLLVVLLFASPGVRKR
jgi:hypothetical protein